MVFFPISVSLKFTNSLPNVYFSGPDLKVLILVVAENKLETAVVSC